MVKCPMDLEPDAEVWRGALLVQVMFCEIFVLQQIRPEFADTLFLQQCQAGIHLIFGYENVNITAGAHGRVVIDLFAKPQTFEDDVWDRARFGGVEISDKRRPKFGGGTLVFFSLFIDELLRGRWNFNMTAFDDRRGKRCHAIVCEQLRKTSPVDI